MSFFYLVGVLVVLASCEKAAPEPVTQISQPASEGDAVPKGPRCVVPLPPLPPALPASGPDPRCPPDPEGGPPMVPVGHVGFPDAPKAPRLEVELMLTAQTQERGLMYRRRLTDDRGMLFVFGTPSAHTFWMHNTCIPLDMLFIDAEGWVAGIVENAPTLDDGSRTIGCPVGFVLEVTAGWSRRYGVLPGQKVDIQGVPAAR